MLSSLYFLIVHGAYGRPESNWFPWMKRELEKHGSVIVPKFPTPEEQSLSAWLKVADQSLENIEPQNTILIGHSIGAALALRMAEKTTQPYKAIFAACAWTGDLGLADFDPINASFVRPAFDWQRVKKGAENITCFAGDNDPYVPLAYSQKVADDLNTELIVVPKGGHLNVESGYQQFPLLFDKIRQFI